MTTWIDVLVYASLTVVFWGCIPEWSRFTIAVIVDRNPDWLHSHPGVASPFANHWFRNTCRAWAALSVAALVTVEAGVWAPSFLADEPRWEALKDVNSALIITGLFFVFGCFLWFERWLRATVPLADRRAATLVRRSVDDYVPRSVQLTVYAIVILHFAVWLFVGVTGRSSTAGFWGMLAFQCVLSGFFLLMVVVAVSRRPSAIDRIFGSGYRCIEVRVAFACQFAPLMNGAARLYEQTGGATPESLDRLLHLGLVACVATLTAIVTMWPPHGEHGGRRDASSRSLRSLPSL